MSRSRKKTPIYKWYADTAKSKRHVSQIKKLRSRVLRRCNRQAIINGSFEFVDTMYFHGKLSLYGKSWFGDFKDNHEFMNRWGWESKDEAFRKYMRK